MYAASSRLLHPRRDCSRSHYTMIQQYGLELFVYCLTGSITIGITVLTTTVSQTIIATVYKTTAVARSSGSTVELVASPQQTTLYQQWTRVFTTVYDVSHQYSKTDTRHVLLTLCTGPQTHHRGTSTTPFTASSYSPLGYGPLLCMRRSCWYYVLRRLLSSLDSCVVFLVHCYYYIATTRAQVLLLLVIDSFLSIET